MELSINYTKLKIKKQSANTLRDALIKIGYEYPNLYVEQVFDLNFEYTVNGKFGEVKFTLTIDDME